MKTLKFYTNINCPLHLEKAVCALECLHGRYCQFSVDLMDARHTLKVKTDSLQNADIMAVLQQEGLECEVPE